MHNNTHCIEQLYLNIGNHIKLKWIILFLIILMCYLLKGRKSDEIFNRVLDEEIRDDLDKESNKESDYESDDESDEALDEDPDLELMMRNRSDRPCRCFFDDDDEEKEEEWSDHRGHIEAAKLGLNFKLKNQGERDFYENQIIKDKYKNLETYERSIYHHRYNYTYGHNAELGLWEKDKNYLIRSWKSLKQEFFNAETLKQKYSHLKAFEHTIKYKPIKFTGRHKQLNKRLRKSDNEHLMKMRAEIKNLIESE